METINRRLEVLEAENAQLKLTVHATQDRARTLEQDQRIRNKRSLSKELYGGTVAQ